MATPPRASTDAMWSASARRLGHLGAAVAVAALAAPPRALADEVGFPCDGCVVVGAPGGAPRPLVVLLHGDEGGPSRLVSAWRAAAEKANVTLLALKCPRSEGCVGSFWQWDGSPRFVLDQVDRLEEKYPADSTRRYLGGWSGGSTYLTFHLDAWFPTFAAVSVAGGGAPRGSACFPRAGGPCAPIHYMMGDRNPLFDLAVRARDGAIACGHDVTWQLLPGADHEAEWRAYSARTGEILAWLLARTDGCGGAPIVKSEPPTPPSDDASSRAASSAASPPTPTAAALAPPPRVAPGCSCRVCRTSRGDLACVGLTALAACAASLRRRRGRSGS